MATLLPYTLSARNICLDIFDSNVPRYFDPAERKQFASFLMAPLGQYFVVERDGDVLACGDTSCCQTRQWPSLHGAWSTVSNTVAAWGGF